MVTVPMAATNQDLWDVPVEVCGHVVKSPRPEPLMAGRDQWLYVDPRAGDVLKVGTVACVTGVVRRRDGLSNLEARARRLPLQATTDAPNSDLILRPCSDQKSCDALIPADVKARGQARS